MGIGSFGGTELIIALVIILLLFGAKRIPELARGLGSGVREFRRGSRGDYEVEEEEEKKEEKSEELTAGEDKTHPEDTSAEADQAEQKRS
jgi:sec-independent protein translocase protein TatA